MSEAPGDVAGFVWGLGLRASGTRGYGTKVPDHLPAKLGPCYFRVGPRELNPKP